MNKTQLIIVGEKLIPVVKQYCRPLRTETQNLFVNLLLPKLIVEQDTLT
jgi:hypothetical protein